LFPADELAAIMGHTNLIEVSRSAKAAEQKELAKAAMSVSHFGRRCRLPKPHLLVWECWRKIKGCGRRVVEPRGIESTVSRNIISGFKAVFIERPSRLLDGVLDRYSSSVLAKQPSP
jgi:hypothetical protein